jgi:hypothetical protein
MSKIVIPGLTLQRSLDLDGTEYILLTWSSSIPDLPFIIGFNIYRADRKDGDYSLVGEKIQINCFRDPVSVSYWESFYYKVVPLVEDKKIKLDEVEPISFLKNTPFGFNTRAKYIYKEIIRRNNWLRKQVGEDCLIYLRKRVGEKCPVCYSEESQRATNPRCSRCFGTGIDGGYVKIKVRLGYEPAERRLTQTEWGLEVVETPRFFIADYPYISDWDILLRRDGSRWQIAGVIPIRIGENYLVQQEFKTRELPSGFPEFSYDL